MKIRLICQEKNRERLSQILTEKGFELSDQAKFSFVEDGVLEEELCLKLQSGELEFFEFSKIVLLESFNHKVVLYDKNGLYQINATLIEVERKLPQNLFLRISQSCIINRSAIEKVESMFGCSYYLTLKNGKKVSVSRNYYQSFKRSFLL